MKVLLIPLYSAALAVALSMSADLAFANSDWRLLDPENTLIIDTTKGRLIIEMRPEMAPKAVQRVKMLAREKVYDGLQFHRVIALFVAQTGNPNNKDGGGTAHPNLEPEFTFRYTLAADEAKVLIASRGQDQFSGLMGSVPFQSTPTNAARAIRAWGSHCADTMGMGRNEALNSANSEIYFMLDATRRLDHDYTLFARVISGQEVLRKITLGEPPSEPDLMNSVRVAADMPIAERPVVSVLSGQSLAQLIEQKRAERGADFSICDISIPVKIDANPNVK